MALHQVDPPDGGERRGGADDTPGTGPVLPCPVPPVESKPTPAQRGTRAASKDDKNQMSVWKWLTKKVFAFNGTKK